MSANAIIGESGIIRRIDDLGRIVLPKELRRHIRAEDDTPCELIPCRDELGRAFIAVKPYDMLAADISIKRCKKLLETLREVTNSTIRVGVYSRHGVELGDICQFLDAGEMSAEKQELMKKRTQMEQFILSSAGDTVWTETVTGFGEEAMLLTGFSVDAEGGKPGAVLFAYGKKDNIEAAQGPLWLAAQALCNW